MLKPRRTGTKAGAVGLHDGFLGVKLPTPIGHACPEAELQVVTKHHGLQQQKASSHLPLLMGNANAVFSPILTAWEICQRHTSRRLDPRKSKMYFWAQTGKSAASTSAGRNTGMHTVSKGFQKPPLVFRLAPTYQTVHIILWTQVQSKAGMKASSATGRERNQAGGGFSRRQRASVSQTLSISPQKTKTLCLNSPVQHT